MMWICPNATKAKLSVNEHMGPEVLNEAKRRECAFALCNSCRHNLLMTNDCSARASRGSKRRKVDTHECNHADLSSGLITLEDQKYFTEEMIKKHGCKQCDECKKLIPLKNNNK